MTTKSISVVTARHARGAFTLTELLISVVVVTMIIFMVAQLMTSATTVTRTGNKHIDTDTQARTVLDRVAADFAQMLKRTDIDYYIKQPGRTNYPGNSAGHSQGQGKKASSGQELNDQMAFFSQVPGYYPSGAQSPVSLVAYRVNGDSSSQSYLKLERMGKGLLWNGVSNATNPSASAIYPIVFLPQTIANVGSWSAAVKNDNSNSSKDSDYETVGPQVFRFEYYYLLKNGNVTDTPWNTDLGHTSLAGIGLSDIEAIGIAIAVIDPGGGSLITPASLFDLASDMDDFKTQKGKHLNNQKTGQLEDQWNSVVASVATTGLTSRNSPVPPAAAAAIRIYSRYFDLKIF
jgi:competence protein ComGC